MGDCSPIGAEATYLISEDKDLLVLQRYGETQIINVAAFLNILEQQPADE